MLKPLSRHMLDMVQIASDALTRAPRPLSEADWATIAEIRRIDALPAETARHTHAPLAMCAALEGLEQTDGHAPDSTPWLVLIGAVLPVLKAEAFRQLCAEREVGRD